MRFEARLGPPHLDIFWHCWEDSCSIKGGFIGYSFVTACVEHEDMLVKRWGEMWQLMVQSYIFQFIMRPGHLAQAISLWPNGWCARLVIWESGVRSLPGPSAHCHLYILTYICILDLIFLPPHLCLSTSAPSFSLCVTAHKHIPSPPFHLWLPSICSVKSCAFSP